MTKTTRISIKEPCSENWEKMTPDEQGRFCQSCQKSVVDIQTWSDEKLLNFLAESKGKSCIKASKQQLNRALIQAPNSSNKWNAYLGGFLALCIATIAPAQSSDAAPTEIVLPNSIKYLGNPSNETPDSVHMVFAGIVIDSLTKESVPFCTVVLIAGDIGYVINGVVTDENGRFSLAYDGDTLAKLFLEISYVGYENKIVHISHFQNSQQFEILMNESTMGMMGDLVVIQPKKPWRKFWR